MSDRRFFRLAGAFNLLGALSATVSPAFFYRLAYGYDGPLDALWLQLHYGFWFLIALIGLGYALIGEAPEHNRAMLVVGIAGKVAFALFWIAQVIAWRGKLPLVLGALGDLAFAALFVRRLRPWRPGI